MTSDYIYYRFMVLLSYPSGTKVVTKLMIKIIPYFKLKINLPTPVNNRVLCFAVALGPLEDQFCQTGRTLVVLGLTNKVIITVALTKDTLKTTKDLTTITTTVVPLVPFVEVH